MYERYKDRVEFLLMYVREAHPIDGRISRANEREGIRLASANTFEQKEDYASTCVRNLGIKFTTLIDGMDNWVGKEYAGHPDRLYLVGLDERILYKSGPGPRGFKPHELEEAIQRALGISSAPTASTPAGN